MFIFNDAFSAVLFLEVFHLVILNTFIGFIEFGVINNLSKKENINLEFKIKNILLVIIANYFSAFLGYVGSGLGHILWVEKYLRDAPWWLIGFIFICLIISVFIITIVAEFPFFWYYLKNKFEKTKIVRILLIANLFTNIPLLVLYAIFYKIDLNMFESKRQRYFDRMKNEDTIKVVPQDSILRGR